MDVNFEICARTGVGPILFGMTATEVRELLGDPDWTQPHREAYLGGLIVHYDLANLVDFIEVIQPNLFCATFQGRNLHGVIAEEALTFVGQFGYCEEAATAVGASHIFPSLELSLRRRHANEASVDAAGSHLEGVGVGRSGYFSV